MLVRSIEGPLFATESLVDRVVHLYHESKRLEWIHRMLAPVFLSVSTAHAAGQRVDRGMRDVEDAGRFESMVVFGLKS